MTDYSAFYINQASSDPTRTLTLRSKWVAENNRRFAMLKAVIRKSVVDNDGFGLRERGHFQAQASLPPAAPRAWAYRWSHEKVDAFMKWLKEMEEKSILEIVHRPGTLRPEGEPWTNLYVRSTYQRGLSMAMARVRERSIQMGSLLGLGEADFPPTFLPTGRAISAIMAQPFHADRLALAYTRVFDELKGVSAAMDQQISRELTRGIAQGLNPRDIGDKIADRVEKIGATRGRLIARTETIHVHAQAALNEYYSVEQNTGEVVLIQWSATMDSRTRDTHIERHNRVYTKEEAYALIGEPNCRCALLPYIPAIQGVPEKASDAAMAVCQREASKELAKAKAPPAQTVRKDPLSSHEYPGFLKDMEDKYGKDSIWSSMNDSEMEKLERLESSYHRLKKDIEISNQKVSLTQLDPKGITVKDLKEEWGDFDQVKQYVAGVLEEEEYDNYGFRIVTNLKDIFNEDYLKSKGVDASKIKDFVKVGDVLGPSYIWEDGEITDKVLKGTSTLGIKNESDIDKVIKLINSYSGRQIIFVGSKGKAILGEDVGELILKKPKVIASWFRK